MSVLDSIPGLKNARGGVFYLHGADHYRREEAVRLLIAQHLDSATRDFNLDPLRGTEVDAETLASVLATPPMMAQWRVVVVREVEGLASSKRSREILLAAVADPPPGLALILSCTVPQGSKAKFYRTLAKESQAVEFRAVTEADVPGWLMKRGRDKHGIDVEGEAARALGSAIGTDLGVLAQELDKLSEFVGDRKTVTLEDVRAVGTRVPAQDRWRWFDLVGDRRFEEARAALSVLFGQGETGVGLVIGLTTQFLRMGVASQGGRQGLEAALPPHQRWLAPRIAAQAKQWPPAEIDRALEGLLRVDRLLKASSHTDEHFLEEWLLTLWVQAEAA